MNISIVDYISEALSLPRLVVRHRVFSAPLRYKVYTIPKANGKLRTIAQPARDIKSFQRLMVAELLSLMPIHDCAFAYVKGKGIRDNAAMHCKSSYLLKLDFKDFFPSIKPDDLIRRLAPQINMKFSAEDKRALSCLFFWKPRKSIELQLSVGAPSSPLISNIVMYEFDCAVSAFCASIDVVYTRYADDLCFSTKNNNTLIRVHDFIKDRLSITESPNLALNVDKTINVSKRNLRTVTGIVLTPTEGISLGRERKRTIRAQVDHYQKGTLSAEDFFQLKGWIAYASNIEPEFVQTLLSKVEGAMRQRLFPRRLVLPHSSSA